MVAPAKAQRELQRRIGLAAQLGGEHAFQEGPGDAHHQLVAIGAPVHGGAQVGADDGGHVGRGIDRLGAAAHLRMAVQRHHHQEEVGQLAGLDAHFGAVAQAAQAHVTEGEVVHARIEPLARTHHLQRMRLHHP